MPDGRPVWLSSLSKVNPVNGRIVPTGRWTPQELQRRYERLVWALRGVGDASVERVFRMNITLCLHRPATWEEVDGLPDDWKTAESGMAGPPVEHLWAKGVVCSPSAMPCHNPGKIVLDASDPDMWAPNPCGVCETCLARAAVFQRAALVGA
jgi:hypothetical protein